jgi:large subunit ribosomal protein L14
MLFNVADNSGAFKVKCVSVVRTVLPSPAGFLTVVVKSGVFSKKVQKGDVCRAVVVRLVRSTKRSFGYCASYSSNAVVLLKKNEIAPLGTRVRGTVFFELHKLGFTRIVSLAAALV